VKKPLFAGLMLLAASAVPTFGAGSDDRVYASHLMVDQEVTVAARITGIIETIQVDRGSVVGQGQVLATIEPREYDAAVRQAKEDMDLRKIEYERAESLVSSSVMSAQDRDEKRAQYQVAVATWERAKAVRDYTVIRAPFAGIVTEKFARVGEKVIEDKFDPLFKVTAVEPLLARVYLPEEQLLSVKVGDRVDVVAERFPDVRTTGEVQFVSPAIDPGSGTFQVVVRVRREPGKSVLRPGLAVKVRFAKTPAR
jgi:membrane fusion protein, multidrug efflux system